MTEEHREATVLGVPGLVRLNPPVPVEVWAQREWWPGWANAYRGERVSCRWSRGPGLNHLTWQPAEHVRRV